MSEMKWTSEADAAIKKVPFFVRKRVRRQVENEVGSTGKRVISLADVKAVQKRYLNSMASEIKGYQLDACFGPTGCPNRAVSSETLVDKLERCLKNADILSFLKAQVGDRLKFHHEFRVTVCECPNACSQPQIKDIGIIGARKPGITHETCTACNACVDACPDDAIEIESVLGTAPALDRKRCMACGKCIDVCPTASIIENQRGYKVLVGGKLGRHPRLAQELPGIYSENEVVKIVTACIDFYKADSRGGKRFSEILTPAFVDVLANRFEKTQN